MPPPRALVLAAIAASVPACAPSRAPQALEPQPRLTAPPSRAPEPEIPTASPASPEGQDRFANSVKPMLASRCAPCHVPGGKMYERLPFDDPEVVRSHQDGILKRLKGDDSETVRGWLALSK